MRRQVGVFLGKAARRIGILRFDAQGAREVASFAGSVMARELADAGRRVHVIDKRPHIAGNDEYDDHGVLIDRYGPRIFRTRSRPWLTSLQSLTNMQSLINGG